MHKKCKRILTVCQIKLNLSLLYTLHIVYLEELFFICSLQLASSMIPYLKSEKKMQLIFLDVQASSHSGLFQVEFCFLEEGDSLMRNFE